MRKRSKAFEKIAGGLTEALAIARGEAKPAKLHVSAAPKAKKSKPFVALEYLDSEEAIAAYAAETLDQYDTVAFDFMASFDKFITDQFGDRCADFEADCSCCRMWKLRDQVAEIVIMHEDARRRRAAIGELIDDAMDLGLK
jgi:hypothetical protein